MMRSAGLLPDHAKLKTRGDIVAARHIISVALGYLHSTDSELADKLAALPPEEIES